MKTEKQGETRAMGQLLQSSISWQIFFSLLLKTCNFPILQEGKEMHLIGIFCPGTGYLCVPVTWKDCWVVLLFL